MESAVSDMKYCVAQVEDTMGQLGEKYPAFWEAYWGFSQEAKKEGVLSKKIKELICIAIGIAVHCTFCIAIHTKKAIDAGASREEIMETAFVAAAMGGGPSVAYLWYVIDALDQLGAD